MKVYVSILLLMGCCLIYADTDVKKTTEEPKDVAEKEEPKPLQEVCEVCTCEAKTQTVNCISSKIIQLFTIEEWTKFNNTNISMDIVSFEENKITNVSVFPALSIRVLILKENAISSIATNAFRDLSLIEEIDLSSNRLTFESLRPNIFEGKYDPEEYEPLKLLKVLNLGNNRIHSLDSDVFEHLPMLEKLMLDSNPFMVLDHGTTIAISSIPKLKYLDLSYMELRTLPEHIFHTPRYLTHLNLTGNLIAEIPDALTYAINLEFLSIDENPMENLDEYNVFPKLTKLKHLSISYMAPLKTIGKGALSGLTSLSKLVIANNHHLSSIHPDALSSPGASDRRVEEWPPIKELTLYNNNISVLESHLLGRWDNLDLIDIRMNPWQCDCENQWIIDTIIPLIKNSTTFESKLVVCDHPIEMIGIEMSTLTEKHSKLRCLDKYNHRPERDGTILIGILVGLLIGIPISLSILFAYRRGCFGLLGYTGPADYSRAFYKRADMQDDLRIHI